MFSMIDLSLEVPVAATDNELSLECSFSLSSYSRPLFIRVRSSQAHPNLQKSTFKFVVPLKSLLSRREFPKV